MPARRSLGRAAIALIVLDVVLIGVLVALLLTAQRPAGGDGETAEPTTSAAATDPVETATDAAPAVTPPADALDVAGFALPSRNIWCAIGDAEATCEIGSITFTPPDVEDCEGEVGHVLVVTEAEASLPCVSEPVAEEASADLPNLEYGQTTAVGDFMCTADTDGVTCQSLVSGRGFTLASGGFTLF